MHRKVADRVELIILGRTWIFLPSTSIVAMVVSEAAP